MLALCCYPSNVEVWTLQLDLGHFFWYSLPGAGLNLTRANNVILLDLAWSQAIEAQAFDRLALSLDT